MKPATNLREIVNGLWCWSALHEEWNVDFSCSAWLGGGGLVLVDPVRLDDANRAKLETIGTPAAILLTNQNHERDADWFRRQYGIKVHVHRDAVPGIEITPDEFFCDGAEVPGGLRAVHVPGASLSETAFFTEASGGIVIAGDVVINGKGGLTFLAEEHCQDAKQSRESAKKLLPLRFETLTTAHGDPVHPGARQRFGELFV